MNLQKSTTSYSDGRPKFSTFFNVRTILNSALYLFVRVQIFTDQQSIRGDITVDWDVSILQSTTWKIEKCIKCPFRLLLEQP